MAKMTRPTFEELGAVGVLSEPETSSTRPRFEDFAPVKLNIDPQEEKQRIKDITDTAIDLRVSSQDVMIHYPALIEDPQGLGPSKEDQQLLSTIAPWLITKIPDEFLQKGEQPMAIREERVKPQSFWKFFKGQFKSDRRALVPDASRMEVADRVFDAVIGKPLRVGLKFGMGALLGAPDILWAGLKRITPKDSWDEEVRNMTLTEAMDWAAGYNPSGFEKYIGEISEFTGRLSTVVPLAERVGLLQDAGRTLSVLEKASQAALAFMAVSAEEQAIKFGATQIDPTETDYGYEGPIAVLRDMAVGAALSLAYSGGSALWSKLTPTERSLALKTLGLKEGATQPEITKAANDLARQTHPDKVKGMVEEYKKVISARDTLRAGEATDVVFRGQKTTWTGKGEVLALPGAIEKPTGVAQKPPEEAVIPAQEPSKPAEPTVTTPQGEIAAQPAPVDEWTVESLNARLKNLTGKELWEQTKWKWQNEPDSGLAQPPFSGGRGNLDLFQAKHKEAVRQALSENKAVPEDVLWEYGGEKWADEALTKMKPVAPPAPAAEKAVKQPEVSTERPTLEKQAQNATIDDLQNMQNFLEGEKQKRTLSKDDTARLRAIKNELLVRYRQDPKWAEMSDNEWLTKTRFYRSGGTKNAELPDGRRVILSKESTESNFREQSRKFILSTKPVKQAPPGGVTPAPEARPGEVPGGGVAWHTAIPQAMERAEKIRPRIIAEQKASLRQKFGAAAGTLKTLLANKVPPREALWRSMGKLKKPIGEYEKVYQGLDEILEPWIIESAYQDIIGNPDRSYLDKIHLVTPDGTGAFDKLVAGTYLRPSDVEYLKKWQPSIGKLAEGRVKPASIWDRIVEVWRAGLLTGIKTSHLNELSNLTHALTEVGKDIPGAGVDIIQSLFTGKRALIFTARGIPSGMGEGFVKGWEYLRTGIDERQIGMKYEYKQTDWGNNPAWKALKAYHDAIFHLLGAEDEPFFYGALTRALYNQAIARGINKKLKGKALSNFVANKVHKPTKKMLNTATVDAETAVFQNKTKLGDIGAAIQEAGGKLVVAFSRTPSAVAMQIINYGPVGPIKEIIEQLAKKEYDQRRVSQAFGRAILGTGALFLGGWLLKQGLVTLGYPKSEKERKLWELENRKENSILIGGKWRSVFVLGPIGNVLLIGGYFQRALTQTGSPSEAIATAMAGGAKSFTEQTFLRGLSAAVDALVDPERSFELFFSNLAGSAVPTLVADIARATDSTERRTSGAVEKIMSRLPGTRELLEPRLDVFGQDVPRYGGNIFEVMVDPTRPFKVRQDLVVDELRRLWDKGIKVSPTQVGDRMGYNILTDEENTQLWRRAGELTYQTLVAIITVPDYQEWPDEDKEMLIDRSIKEAKDLARAEMARVKISQGLTVEELKKDGLVTQDVERMGIE